MKFIYAAIIILLFAETAIAQSISGRATNNKGDAIPYAPVTLLQAKDSSIVAFSNTDNNGCYTLRHFTRGNYLLSINCLGYLAQVKNVSINNDSVYNLSFMLDEKAIALHEVTVKGRFSGISFGNDTIRYNPKVFTDGSEVVLSDVLNKLPGIEVDTKGNIKAHGKQVDKLLLNGQDFFAGNTQMAAKNLPAKIAESVEVLNNYSEYSLLNGFQSHEQTVINVGVNKNLLGKISGNVSVGGGIENKYNVTGNLMRLDSKSMTALLGAQNNTGEEVFSLDDYLRLQGGVNEVMGNNGNFELTEDEQRLLMPLNNMFSQTNRFSALNYSYQPKAKFKLNSYLLYNNNKTEAEDLNLYTYHLPNGENLFTRESINNKTKNKFFSGYLKTNYSPCSTLSIVYNGSASCSNMNKFDDISNQVKEQTVSNNSVREVLPFRMQHKLFLMKSIGKHLLLGNASLNYNYNPVKYSLATDSLLLPLKLAKSDGWYFGQQDIHQKQLSSELSLAFLYRINQDYYLRTVLGSSFNNQIYRSDVYEDISSHAITFLGDSLHNDVSFKTSDYYSGVDFIKHKGFFRFKLGALAHIYDYSIKNTNLQNENVRFQINPLVELSLIFSEKHSINVALTKKISSNSIKEFADRMIFESNQSYTNNEPLTNFYNSQYNLNLRYNFFDLFSNTMIILTGNYSRTCHSFAYNYNQEGLLSAINSFISPTTENGYATLYLNKGLGSIPWVINFTGRYIYGKSYNQLSGFDNRVETHKITNQLKFESKYQYPLNAEAYVKLENLKNSILIGQDYNQSIQRYGCKLKLKANERLYSEAGIEYSRNVLPGLIQNQYLMNGNIRYLLQKKLELQLKATNFLNLHKMDWSNVSYKANYSLEQFFRQMPGNIILSIKYSL